MEAGLVHLLPAGTPATHLRYPCMRPSTLSMAGGGKTTISREGNDVYIDGAKIVAWVRGANGMVHVIDAVIVPGAK